MNKDIIAGKWTQLKGQAQARWGNLTDDDFDVGNGCWRLCRRPSPTLKAGVQVVLIGKVTAWQVRG